MIKELISCIKNFPKHTKTAFQNIVRNGAMSFSSIFAVTITLLLIGIIGVVAISIQDITYSVEKELIIHVKLESDTPEEKFEDIQGRIESIDHVVSVAYSSKEEELQKLINANPKMASIYESYREDNPLGVAFIVETTSGESLQFVKNEVEKLDYVNAATYGGSSTENLVNVLRTVRNIGGVSVIALVVIALFMISNTIKMTINYRSTEISIMRMVGASNWYVRIPFMIEGLLIGLFGSIVPIIIVYFGYTLVFDSMSGVFISNLFVLRNPNPFIFYYLTFIAGLGSVVGAIGSYFSIRKHLKY